MATLGEVLTAVRAARETQANADRVVQQCVLLIKGRLRAADVYREDLVELKRELQSFDAARKRWKKR